MAKSPQSPPDRQPQKPRSDTDLLLAESKIPREAKQDVLNEIEEIIRAQGIPAGSDLFTLHPRKKGYVFPLLINLAAVAVIAAGIYVFSHYFNVRQESLTLEAGGLFSAEGRLIEELKRDAEQRLRAKDAEISRAQTRLESLGAERQSLQETMEERISQREADLRLSLEEELTVERERLQGLGTSAEDIGRRLRALEESKSREYTLALEEFRKTSEAEMRAKEEELAAATQLLTETLDQSSREKEAISREAQAKEEELRRSYEQEAATLEAKSSQAERQLTELAELRRREELFTDQVLAAYAKILADLDAADLNTARRELSGLAGLLAGATTENLPAVAKRKRIDLAIITSLEELVDLKTAQPVAPAALAAAAGDDAGAAAADLQRLLDEAAALAAAGRLQEASSRYTRALQTSPGAAAAHEGLTAVERRLRGETLQQGIAEAERLLRQGQEIGALESYRNAMAAAGDAPLTGSILEGAERAVAQREGKKLADSQSSIAALRRDQTARRREIEALQARLAAQEEEIAQLKSRLAAAPAAAALPADAAPLNEERVVSRARAEAFRDLQTYLRAQSDLSAYPELEATLEREPQFRRVIADIESLLSGQAGEQALAAGIARLLGTVSRVLPGPPGQVVIEPLVKVTAEPGASILIRRSVLGREISIARGTVDRVAADRITATIQQVFQAGRLPAEQDTVYLTK